MPEQKFFETKLLSKQEIAADVFEFVFSKPEGYQYLPGQYAQFKIQDNSAASGFILRSYSIASVTAQENLLFCIKLLPGGKASEFFRSFQVGESLRLSSALGNFVVKPESLPAKIFIATGTGIAPVKSMIDSELSRPHPACNALRSNAGRPTLPFAKGRGSVSPPSIAMEGVGGGLVTLLFGLRHDADVFWQDYFENLSKQYPENFAYLLTLSQPSVEYTGARGRVTDQLPKFLSQTAEYYVCGSLPMIKDTRQILAEAKIPPARIHFEIF